MKPAHGTSPLACLCLLVLSGVLPAWAGDQPPTAAPNKSVSKQLAPITVPGQRNPLDRSDKRLRAHKKSLPGTDRSSKKGFARWYAEHRDPNKMSAADKRMTQNMIGKDQPYRPSELELQRP
jgi:hypothetical protein